MPCAGGARPLQHRLVLGLAAIFIPIASLWAPVSARPLSTFTETDRQQDLQVPLRDNLEAQLQPERKLQGRFLHVSDFHPDEFYRVHSSTEENIACHRGKGLAGTFGAEKTDCDSPYTLVNATFKWIQENVRDKVDFVIWTGDSARHDSDENHPRHEAEVLRSNRIIADQFLDVFASDDQLSIPVIPTFGNNDFLPHNLMYAGPNKWFHAYADIWHRFIPEEQRHTFGLGGWFSVEAIPNHLAVFSLNTMFFFDRNPAIDGCAHPDEPGYKQLEWLRVQLQIIRESGMKAILMGHVPPARTPSKQLWDETCWQKYTLWLKQYRDVVIGSLYGHMNIDHFLLQDVEDLQPSLGAEQVTARGFLEDELWVKSKEDYLQELRDGWAELPSSIVHVADDDEETSMIGRKGKGKKKHKGKYHDIGGEHAERFQLSLISPSVVPNYFPTLRIVEYNITGLEEAALWEDPYDADEPSAAVSILDSEVDVELGDENFQASKKKGKKKEKSKPGRKPPGDHNLKIPEGPPKDSPPGPAYFAQSLSLIGYTQYFANLTRINDDIPDEVDGTKWRKGQHDHKSPKHGEPKPLEFKYEVEYSTFDDKVYKLPDLTVKNYLQLAYRMGETKQKAKSGGLRISLEDDDWFADEDALQQGDQLEQQDELDSTTEQVNGVDLLEQNGTEEGDMEDVDALGKKHKKHKKKKKENNKTWLQFLERAFVSTVPLDELRDM